MFENFCSIIVTYYPSIINLSNLLNELISLDIKPIIIDNSEEFNFSEIVSLYDNKIYLHQLNDNCGIARAQNLGIDIAIKEKYQKVIFFDQDSYIDQTSLINILKLLDKYPDKVIGPIVINKNTNIEYPSYKIKRFGKLEKINGKFIEDNFQVDLMISSGTALKLKTFISIGNFDEKLFIDFVDHEWCLRAKKKKIDKLICNKAFLYHEIGERNEKFLSKSITIHSPIRTYYKVRNSFLMIYKTSFFLLNLRVLIKNLIINLIVVLKSKNKLYVKYYLIGVLHGIIKFEGKYNA